MAIPKRRAWRIGAAFVVVLALGVGLILQNRLWREQPQPNWISTRPGALFGDTQFKYLSIGLESDAGLPYWVFYVLPMMFPEKLPRIGGYAAFGLPWEQGVELPVGLTKVTIGYPRVGFNCAACHATRYRGTTGSGHTANIEALSRFFYDCAKDPRFESDNILSEIGNFTKLDWIDRLLYRFYIIPRTKDQILQRGENFLWAYRNRPATANGNQGHEYGNNLSDGDKHALIEFVKTL